MNRKFRFTLMVCAAALSLSAAGCSSNGSPQGKPLPTLTFEHVEPLMVDVADVNIDNRFQPGFDMDDVSSSFPMPPDMALAKFTAQRLQPDGNSGVLNVVIKDAHVYRSEVKPEGGLNQWFGMNDSDLYEVMMAVSMYSADDLGQRNGPMVDLTFSGDLKVPEHYSIAEREDSQLRFLETLMKEVDKSYVNALRGKLSLMATGYDPSAPAYEPALRTDRSDRGAQTDDRSYDAPDDDYMVDGALEPPQSLAPPEMR